MPSHARTHNVNDQCRLYLYERWYGSTPAYMQHVPRVWTRLAPVDPAPRTPVSRVRVAGSGVLARESGPGSRAPAAAPPWRPPARLLSARPRDKPCVF